MGMSSGGDNNGMMAEINVTPFVDVMLVLLIIFMVVTQMLQSGVEVKLPNARTTTSVQDVGQHLVISIRTPLKNKTEPRMYVDRLQSSKDMLISDINDAYADNPSRSILVKGAKDLRWKEAYSVLQTISEGGMTTMLLATEKEE